MEGEIRGFREAPFSATMLAVAMIASIPDEGRAQQSACLARGAVEYADQGWSALDRRTFYGTSQGSHLMPYAWFKALRRADNINEAFAADQLQRYGYICSDSPNNGDGLPIGFVVDLKATPPQVGLTCAACHTGQVEYQRDGVPHVVRLDGAPAKVNIQEFVTDLLAASRATLTDAARFESFAKMVLGGDYPAKAADLKNDFNVWSANFSEFLKTLPSPSWGPGRIDAFGMIYNRVAGLDLGKPGNMQTADAPVKYPFLWNASRQDHTQWNGQMPNGLPVLGLARNVGEVLGVFAEFTPKKIFGNKIDYSANSVDFAGLQTLEEEIEKLQPPKWPFAIDAALANEGRPLFERKCGRGCHEKKSLFGRWATPRKNVGTDPKMALNAKRDAPDPGLFTGKVLLWPSPVRLANPARAGQILALSVIGITVDGLAFQPLRPSVQADVRLAQDKKRLPVPFDESLDAVSDRSLALRTGDRLFFSKGVASLLKPPSDTGPAYEARVLCGIWAVAPYLHNGSVPNLKQLLTPSRMRQARFMVGSRAYDPDAVGYATDNSPFSNGTFVTDPQNGNGNGGHDYGTDLPNHEKAAIIEYMKTLDAESPSC